MEKARPELVAVVLLIGSGVGLAAAGDLQFRWTGFALLLSSAALAGLRGCLLQRVLHGYDVGLLIRKQQVHPVQLVYALAPWTTLTALITTLVLERDFLIFFLELHSPHLRLFTLRLVGVGCLILCMVLTEMHVVAKTSALTLSIAGTLKEVIALAVAERVFNERLSALNVVGVMLCVVGTQVYGCLKLCAPASSPPIAGRGLLLHGSPHGWKDQWRGDGGVVRAPIRAMHEQLNS